MQLLLIGLGVNGKSLKTLGKLTSINVLEDFYFNTCFFSKDELIPISKKFLRYKFQSA